MVNIKIASDLVDLQKLKKRNKKFKSKWCREQKEDIQKLFSDVEDLITLAATSSLSTFNYEQLQSAKLTFINTVIETSEKYRLIKPKTRKLQTLNTSTQ